MGLACVDGVGVDAGVWARRGPKSRSAGRVSRRLFGTTADSGRNIQFARQQLATLAAQDSARWNFNFQAMTPLPGPLTWLPADENTPLPTSASPCLSSASPCHSPASPCLTTTSPASPVRRNCCVFTSRKDMDEPQAKRLKLEDSSCLTPASPCLTPAASPCHVLTSNNSNQQAKSGGATLPSPCRRNNPATTSSPAGTSSTPATAFSTPANTSTIPATASSTPATSPTKQTRRSPKRHLKRLRQNFRQTLCTDYFRKVKSAAPRVRGQPGVSMGVEKVPGVSSGVEKVSSVSSDMEASGNVA